MSRYSELVVYYVTQARKYIFALYFALTALMIQS